MASFPQIVIACPHCGRLARTAELSSAPQLDAQVWTDGKWVVPGEVEPPEVGQCLGCGGYYWVEELEPLGVIPADSEVNPSAPFDPAWLEADRIGEPSAADYFAILESGEGLPEEEEMNLRLLAWWRVNDDRRYQEAATVEPPDGAEARNLARLLELLDGSELDQRVFIAEILRQLGKFEDAKQALEGITSVGYARAVFRIRQLAEAHDRRLARIDETES